MKKIICYGDSNTFGFNPADGSRYDENIRWTSILQKNLKTKYEVINEGMCDRTGFTDNPNGFLLSAQKHFPKLIKKTENIDSLVLWIGTNDLQFQYNIDNNTIESGLENLIKIAQTKTKNIIIIPTVVLSEKILEGFFKCKFDKTSIEKSKKVKTVFKTYAKIYNCKFFDVNKIVQPSEFDGLHYSINSHKIIADNLASLL